MIVLDHLEPSERVLAGQPSYYGPDLSYDAYLMTAAGWKYQNDIQITIEKGAEPNSEVEWRKEPQMAWDQASRQQRPGWMDLANGEPTLHQQYAPKGKNKPQSASGKKEAGGRKVPEALQTDSRSARKQQKALEEWEAEQEELAKSGSAGGVGAQGAAAAGEVNTAAVLALGGQGDESAAGQNAETATPAAGAAAADKATQGAASAKATSAAKTAYAKTGAKAKGKAVTVGKAAKKSKGWSGQRSHTRSGSGRAWLNQGKKGGGGGNGGGGGQRRGLGGW